MGLIYGWRWFRLRGFDRCKAARLAVGEAVENAARVAWQWLRDEVPLPTRVDMAVSRWVLRRGMAEWPESFAGQQLPVPRSCQRCETRWHAGRSIRHVRCASEIERAAERHVYGRCSRRELIDRFGFSPADVERILSY